jgi:hypothetical protein
MILPINFLKQRLNREKTACKRRAAANKSFLFQSLRPAVENIRQASEFMRVSASSGTAPKLAFPMRIA